MFHRPIQEIKMDKFKEKNSNGHKYVIEKDKTGDRSVDLRRVIDEINDGDTISFEKGVYRISGKCAYKEEVGISNNDYGEKKIVFLS